MQIEKSTAESAQVFAVGIFAVMESDAYTWRGVDQPYAYARIYD